MDNQFVRAEAVLGEHAIQRLKSKHVMVFGLGGVGAACVEALARGGVGHLSLIDNDTVQLSNLNRQLIALHSTLGMRKTQAAFQRLKDIYPDIAVTQYPLFFSEETAESIEFSNVDYIIDAIDSVPSKIFLVKLAQQKKIPLLSCMGTGNKIDPSRLRFADIYKTSVCPLCRAIRQRCRKEGIKKLTVLFSTENPVGASVKDGVSGRLSPGSLSYVPPVAGMMLAGRAILQLSGFSDDSRADS